MAKNRHKMGITPEEAQQSQAPATGPGSLWWLMYGPPTPINRPSLPKAPAPKVAPSQSFLRPSVDVDKYINTEGLFEFVRTNLKKDPNWRPGVEAAVLTLANPSADPNQIIMDITRELRIPENDIVRAGANAWQQVVEPFVRQLERALNLKKPADLPGTFKFQFGRDRSYGLSYGE